MKKWMQLYGPNLWTYNVSLLPPGLQKSLDQKSYSYFRSIFHVVRFYFQLVVSGTLINIFPLIFSHCLQQNMFKLLANVKLFSRCTTLHSAGGNSVLLANSYAKPSSDEITQWTKEVAAWIETLIEADKKKIRRIQNEVWNVSYSNILKALCIWILINLGFSCCRLQYFR